MGHGAVNIDDYDKTDNENKTHKDTHPRIASSRLSHGGTGQGSSVLACIGSLLPATIERMEARLLAGKVTLTNRGEATNPQNTIMKTRQLTDEELKALRDYAAKHGRTWKSQLNNDWSNGRPYGVLLMVRNVFGPSWLVRFQFPKPTADMAYLFVGGKLVETQEMNYREDSFLSVFDRFIRKTLTTQTQLFAIAIRKAGRPFDRDCIFLNEASTAGIGRMFKTERGQPDWDGYTNQIH